VEVGRPYRQSKKVTRTIPSRRAAGEREKRDGIRSASLERKGGKGGKGKTSRQGKIVGFRQRRGKPERHLSMPAGSGGGGKKRIFDPRGRDPLRLFVGVHKKKKGGRGERLSPPVRKKKELSDDRKKKSRCRLKARKRGSREGKRGKKKGIPFRHGKRPILRYGGRTETALKQRRNTSRRKVERV